MARPQKATVDYFPHSVDNSDSLKIIELQFGNDGYTFWFKLLEKLGKIEHHYFDIQKEKIKFEIFCAECRIKPEYAIEILNKLAEIGSIDLELWEQKIIISENFINGIKDAYSRRKNIFWSLCQIKEHLCLIKRINVKIKGVNVYNNPPNFDINPERERERERESKEKEKGKDIYHDPEILKILGIYQKIMGFPAGLNCEERSKLSLLIDELSGQGFNPAETVEKVFKQLKSIEWEFKEGKKRPKINWLLKDNNFFKVLNGEFEGKKTMEDIQNDGYDF